MKKVLQLLGIFLITLNVSGQNIHGQWRGYFNDQNNNISLLQGSTEYVLELEIHGNKIAGTSYTYFNNHQFFVICNLDGTYDSKTKRLVVNEVERIKGSTPPDWVDCLQTHILYYEKADGKELLTGEWRTSPYNKSKNGGCGYGNTTLNRKLLSNDYVFKRQPTNPKTEAARKKLPSFIDQNKDNKPPVAKAAPKPPSNKPAPNAVVKNKQENNSPKPKPGIKPTAPAIAKNEPPKAPVAKPKAPVKAAESKILPPAVAKTDDKIKPQADLHIQHRKENFLKTIEISKDSFTVQLYDNGEVDGDSISLFYNGRLILQHQRLSEKPISVTLSVANNSGLNDLEMYAENLGSIPPNTALMVVTDSGKRYEVFITSDLQKSGVIRFVHKPKL